MRYLLRLVELLSSGKPRPSGSYFPSFERRHVTRVMRFLLQEPVYYRFTCMWLFCSVRCSGFYIMILWRYSCRNANNPGTSQGCQSSYPSSYMRPDDSWIEAYQVFVFVQFSRVIYARYSTTPAKSLDCSSYTKDTSIPSSGTLQTTPKPHESFCILDTQSTV